LEKPTLKKGVDARSAAGGFLDILLKTNSIYTLEYVKQVKQIEEGYAVRLMSTVERFGYEQGLQQGVHQGMQQGECALLELQIKTRFKDVSENELTRIKMADSSLLLRWGSNLMNAEKLEDVFRD
jgi:hypothetical protein